MHAIRQKCRPKHQVLILKCYPRTTKGAVDVKPNSSELSYLLYYATTRRSKVQKVGAFLEKKTASDVWRARIGNVQVTLQILAALIEKAPRDLPLYAPYVLRILSIILRSRDITMVEASTPTFEAFCEHHDGASLSADQEYLHQYEEIVQMYASFAAKKTDSSKVSMSAPVSMRWRIAGLQAIKSVASSEALSSLAGRQLHVVIPVLLENVGPDNEDFLNTLDRRTRMEEKSDVDRAALLRRKTSVATVRTVENSTGTEAAAVSGTTADADKLAEEDIGILAIQCLKQIFVGNNRSQIHGATTAALRFISELVAKGQNGVWDEKSGSRSWAIQIFEMIARWTPVQDRYVILVTTMDTLIRSPPVESNLKQHLVFATMIDSLLKSDINLIGLSVMDVLLGLIQHVLRVLQLNGAAANLQQENGSNESKPGFWDPKPALPPQILSEKSTTPTDIRRDLLARLQKCIGSLATHVYYADQIPDMVTALLLRLKPSAPSIAPGVAVSVGTTDSASAPNGELTEDQSTDGFFSFDHAKVCALEAIKAILLVASAQKSLAVGSLGRNRVPLRVWEGTQWLLRDSEWRVREAYVDALLTWLNREMTKADLRVFEEKSKGLAKTGRDDSATNLTKRAVSNASQREKTPKTLKTAFLQLLHLAVYENALEYVESESDTVLLHLLLTTLVEKLGVNAVRSGLPMIFRLQEDILEAETPSSKIRMGSLCHGYFWAISEKFDFESSPIGIAVQNEIRRRQSKSFWVAQVVLPPVPLAQIGIASAVQKHPPYDLLESESLIPFDDRFQMVKLISLSYADSLRSPVASPPTSPGRGPAHPILGGNTSSEAESSALPEKIKNEMMSEWTKESVIRLVQESSKTVSLSGSRTTANMAGHRNFLAVNGALKNGGTSSGTNSPPGNHTHNHRSRPASTNYGLVGALGKLKKVPSPAAATESSRASVTRVDQLKRVLTGQPGLPGTKDVAHSDASSESMVSYDYTASEISFNPAQQNHAAMERSASLRDPNDRSRSKSRERVTSPDEKARALASHPVMVDGVAGEEEELDFVPPVPPLPAALAGEGTTALDYAMKEDSSRGPSPRKDERSFTRSSWDGRSVVAPDLQSLLSAIDAVEEQKGNVAKPPY